MWFTLDSDTVNKFMSIIKRGLFGKVDKITGYSLVNSAEYEQLKATVGVNTIVVRSFVGTCSTAGDVSNKEVIVNDSKFELVAGTEVYVKFLYTNTAENPTININNSGTKSIWYDDGIVTTSDLDSVSLSNVYTKYIYDGTYWVWAGQSIDRGGLVIDVVSKQSNGLAPQLPDEETTTKYLRQDGTWAVPPDTTYTPASSLSPSIDISGSIGSSNNYARQDHTHAISLDTGDNDGQVKIAGTNVSVKGLGSAAYTSSTSYLASSLKGAIDGLAELGSDGKVLSSQLPSYVDDVLEYLTYSDFPVTGESGKIYIALDTNKIYRWSGTAYVEISESLALGITSSSAYRGDFGNTAYLHATESGKISSAVNSGLYKISVTSEGHISGVADVQKSDITGLGIPGSDTIVTPGGTTGQVLVKNSDTDGDAEWIDAEDMSGLETAVYSDSVSGSAPLIQDPYLKQSDVDDSLSSLSENPAQNKVVKAAVDEIKGRFDYSTTEKVVGKWIDSKPIYQKVLTGTMPAITDGNESALEFDLSALNIDFMINASHTINWDLNGTNDYGFENDAYAMSGGAVRYRRLLYRKSTNKLRLISNRSIFGNCPVIAIIQYTKTTD